MSARPLISDVAAFGLRDGDIGGRTGAFFAAPKDGNVRGAGGGLGGSPSANARGVLEKARRHREGSLAVDVCSERSVRGD